MISVWAFISSQHRLVPSKPILTSNYRSPKELSSRMNFTLKTPSLIPMHCKLNSNNLKPQKYLACDNFFMNSSFTRLIWVLNFELIEFIDVQHCCWSNSSYFHLRFLYALLLIIIHCRQSFTCHVILLSSELFMLSFLPPFSQHSQFVWFYSNPKLLLCR